MTYPRPQLPLQPGWHHLARHVSSPACPTDMRPTTCRLAANLQALAPLLPPLLRESDALYLLQTPQEFPEVLFCLLWLDLELLHDPG
jgi:hypothetical protein